MSTSIDNIKVSVIVPVYNVAEYLHRCLDSLLGQRLKEIEVICIDDCTPDNSGEILDSYAAKDSRIKVIHKTTNEGPMVARKDGYSIARGEYVFFCDGDDYLPDYGLETLYKAAVNASADLTIGQAQIAGEKGLGPKRRDMNAFDNSWESYLNYILNWGTAALWAILFKRELFINTEYTAIKGMKLSEDRRLITEVLLLKHPKICSIDEVVYYYWLNPKSTTRLKVSDTQVKAQFISLFSTYDFVESHSREFTTANDRQMQLYLCLYIENGTDARLLKSINPKIEELLKFSNLRKNLGVMRALHNKFCTVLPGYRKIMNSLRHLIRRVQKKEQA